MYKFVKVAIIVLIFITQSLYAGYDDFKLNGNGARAAGLGYAFTGIADDATAISWNPAGLTQIYGMEASLVGRFGFGSGEITGFENLGIDSWDLDLSSNFQLNFASFVVPFNVGNLNVVGGIAYRRMYDFSSEITQTINAFGMDNEIYEKISGGINAIAPSIGVQLNEMFSVGLTVNILTGNEEFEGDEKTDGVIDDGSEYKFDQDFSGTAIDIGILVKPSDQFSIGATLNLPHTRTVEQHFENFDRDPFDLDAPMFYNIGAAFRATDQLLLAFDYHGRSVEDVEWMNPITDETETPLEDYDFSSIHFGLEYLAGSGNSIIPLRVGFYTEPTFRLDQNEDQIVAKVFTAGAGLLLGNVILDASFEWATSSAEFDLSDEFGIPDFIIEESESGFRVTVGAVLHLGN
jgi:long-chain fatty acid transport protein